MCGIAGIIHRKPFEPDRGLLSRMVKILNHRGPDLSGVYVDGEAGLAHARLSIIDLAGARQPRKALGLKDNMALVAVLST